MILFAVVRLFVIVQSRPNNTRVVMFIPCNRRKLQLCVYIYLFFMLSWVIYNAVSRTSASQRALDDKGVPFKVEDVNMAATFIVSHSTLRLTHLQNKASLTEINSSGAELFTLVSGSKLYSSSSCKLRGDIEASETTISAYFNCGTEINVDWSANIRTNPLQSSYMKQNVVITNTGALHIDFSSVELIDMEGISDTAFTHGNVDGLPVADKENNFFFALEHPMSFNYVTAKRVVCKLTSVPTLAVGQTMNFGAVIGVFSSPRLFRRNFIDYIEQERANPYRQFLHYNSWYDLRSTQKPPYRMEESKCLDRIEAIGMELNKKRNVQIESFLIDGMHFVTLVLWLTALSQMDGITTIPFGNSMRGFPTSLIS